MRGKTRLAVMLLYLSNSPLQFPPQNPPLSKFPSIIPPKVPVLQFALREIEINNRFASWRIHKENGLKLRDWTGMQPLFSGTDEVNVSLQSWKYHPAVYKQLDCDADVNCRMERCRLFLWSQIIQAWQWLQRNQFFLLFKSSTCAGQPETNVDN